MNPDYRMLEGFFNEDIMVLEDRYGAACIMGTVDQCLAHILGEFLKTAELIWACGSERGEA